MGSSAVFIRMLRSSQRQLDNRRRTATGVLRPQPSSLPRPGSSGSTLRSAAPRTPLTSQQYSSSVTALLCAPPSKQRAALNTLQRTIIRDSLSPLYPPQYLPIRAHIQVPLTFGFASDSPDVISDTGSHEQGSVKRSQTPRTVAWNLEESVLISIVCSMRPNDDMAGLFDASSVRHTACDHTVVYAPCYLPQQAYSQQLILHAANNQSMNEPAFISSSLLKPNHRKGPSAAHDEAKQSVTFMQMPMHGARQGIVLRNFAKGVWGKAGREWSARLFLCLLNCLRF
ncbi:hypothetical protein CERZMDRAFT_80804 [Cercospora zeae-maydis SCOH1-5]|uniref:Uncharacterized protein n=1 Tax=Cercospora zeae-maydis SCOH1-5 TaxID=717836 RepID=A0A6A6FTJ9_9PEZI|nr:hypothetical protein CERZMDRAFT_80804 [Cercospora zeae-maydis SCOH1-5]